VPGSFNIHPIYTNSSHNKKTRKSLIMLESLGLRVLLDGIRSPLLYPTELQARCSTEGIAGIEAG
jgi:hypothetical protein